MRKFLAHLCQRADGAEFRWLGGMLAAGVHAIGAAVACVRAHDVQLRAADWSDPSALTVVSRSDAAQEVSFVLRGPTDITVQVRAAYGTPFVTGDAVCVTLTNARFFSTP